MARLGPQALRDHELLSLLIGSGVRGRSVENLAHQVLTLIDADNAPPDLTALIAIRGLGPARSATIAAAFELARRVLAPARQRIRVPSDVLPLVERFVDRDQEHFLAISLNGAHEVTRVHTVSVGLVNRTMVHPREVFAGMLSDRAAAAVLAHNHPSGSLQPSSEDNEITARLVEAGAVLGIPVLDHVIFGTTGYFSYLEHDRLP